MKKLHLTALLAVSLSMGCAAIPSMLSPSSKGQVVANGHAVLRLQPLWQGGGYAAQAEVKSDQDAVHHLEVALFTLGENNQELAVVGMDNQPLSKTIGRADLGQPITFGNLKLKTTYRVKATAFDAASQVISHPCVIDVPVDMDDRPTVQKLAISLLDKIFNGSGTSSVAINAGNLLHSGEATVSLELPPNVTTYYTGATQSLGVAMTEFGGLFFIAGNSLYALKNNQLTRKTFAYGEPVTSLTLTHQKKQPGFTEFEETLYAGTTSTSAIHWNYSSISLGGTSSSDGSVPIAVATYFLQPSDQFPAKFYLDKTTMAVRKGSTRITALNAFNNPSTMVIDAAGNFYVADTGNNVIKTFNINATDSIRVIGSGFSGPQGVAVDKDGNVWVADTGNHAIKMIEAVSGKTITFAGGTQGNKDGRGKKAQFNAPSGLNFDASGSLWVADYGNNSIRKIEVK
ncbi:SMP-30/gluconolactonase/LRE family protein [bacterium]|nr:SMP-30/gluconolactonase/LRE family protein [bacterium]